MKNIAVKTLLKATSTELSDLRHIAESLQNAVSADDISSDETLKTFQRLDYLTQSLEALSEFWLVAGKAVPDKWAIDCEKALKDVKLKDLAATMRGSNDNTSTSDSLQGVLEEF